MRYAFLAAVIVCALPTPTCTGQDSRLVSSCENGDLASCNSVGIDYDLAGRYEEAAQYFRKVCDGGLAIGCSNLAEFYYDGRGVQKDVRRAFQLFSGACETGVTSGCAGFCLIALGNFELGDEAINSCRQIIQQACDGGNPWMCQHAQRKLASDNGCRTGAHALAGALVRSNCLFSIYFGDIESYVDENRSHFSESGDAVRCARVLSGALLTSSIQTYDPTALDRKEELDARLGAMGISPGPTQPTLSGQLFAMGQDISWLADVLPAAARGNYGPMRTPVTEAQQMTAFACENMILMLQFPDAQELLDAFEPTIREVAGLQYELVVDMAEGLAN